VRAVVLGDLCEMRHTARQIAQAAPEQLHIRVRHIEVQGFRDMETATAAECGSGVIAGGETHEERGASPASPIGGSAATRATRCRVNKAAARAENHVAALTEASRLSQKGLEGRA